MVNKLYSFLLKFIIDDNFFIYKFQSKLSPNHASYFKKYVQNHDLFDVHKKSKYSFSLAIQHFQNTVKNLFVKSIIDLKIAVTRSLSYCYVNYSLSNTTQQI